MNTTVTVALAVGAVVVLVAAVALRLADRLGLPSLLLYLALGVALGESGLGINFSDYSLTQTLGVAALVVILAEGGLTTRWADVRRAIGPGLALATLGVLVSVAVTAAAAVWLLDFGWGFALLLAAVISSTDAAAVFATPAPAAAAAAHGGRARGGERSERRPGDPARRGAGRPPHRRCGPHPWWLTVLKVVGELLGGAVVGVAVGSAACSCCAARRCRCRASTRWPPSRCACWPSRSA